MRHDGLNSTEQALRRTAEEFSANRISGKDLPLILEWIAALARNAVEADAACQGHQNEFDAASAAARVAYDKLVAARVNVGYIRG